MAAATLAANGVTGARVSERISLLPDEAGQFDRVLLLAPQSRALGRRWLVEAHGLLRPGGLLHVAGARDAGVQPLIADAAALFGGAHLLGYGGGSRVSESLRAAEAPAPPAWASEPGVAPGSWIELAAALPGGPVTLASLPLAARAEATPSDALEAARGPYDLIASNPPFHAGKGVDTAMAHAFFAQARALLAPGGRIAIVANRFLPYERELAAHFPRLTRLAEDRAYKVVVGDLG